MPQPEYPLFPQPDAPQQAPQPQQPQTPHEQLAMKLAQQFGLPIQAALGFAMKLMTPTAASQPQVQPKQAAPYTYIPKTQHSRDVFMHAMTNSGAKRSNSSEE